jgi:hypothetical protein
MVKICAVLITLPLFSFAQNEGKVWTEVGIGGKITKDLEWGADVTSRFGTYGVETFFPQATLKYKVTKWFRPSMDYRFIADRQLQGYYSYSNRINFNAEFRHNIDRFYLKSRIRYQYGFNRLVNSALYDPEFDQALRFKLEVKYDVNDFFLSPVISGELFYDPQYGPYGQRINKARVFAGFDLDLNNAHSISIGFLYDTRINLPNPRNRHVLSLSYSYDLSWEEEKSDKKKKDEK